MNKWQFKFSDEYPKSSCGHCVPEWKIIFMEISTIAKYKLPTLKDIVLHEFAHAIAGKKAMHGKEFRKVCKQIGCKGNRANNNYECYELRGKFSWQE
jgi:predicted SprT family Zn-dependent metalloprotease